MSVSIGIMIFCYVAVPSRLIGATKPKSNRDKLAASAIGGVLGGVVCAPPHVIERIGILMLGSSTLFIPGLFVLTFGVTLQAGATGAVKAIKMSTKLTPDTPHRSILPQQKSRVRTSRTALSFVGRLSAGRRARLSCIGSAAGQVNARWCASSRASVLSHAGLRSRHERVEFHWVEGSQRCATRSLGRSPLVGVRLIRTVTAAEKVTAVGGG